MNNLYCEKCGRMEFTIKFLKKKNIIKCKHCGKEAAEFVTEPEQMRKPRTQRYVN